MIRKQSHPYGYTYYETGIKVYLQNQKLAKDKAKRRLKNKLARKSRKA